MPALCPLRRCTSAPLFESQMAAVPSEPPLARRCPDQLKRTLLTDCPLWALPRACSSRYGASGTLGSSLRKKQQTTVNGAGRCHSNTDTSSSSGSQKCASWCAAAVTCSALKSVACPYFALPPPAALLAQAQQRPAAGAHRRRASLAQERVVSSDPIRARPATRRCTACNKTTRVINKRPVLRCTHNANVLQLGDRIPAVPRKSLFKNANSSRTSS